MLTEKERADVLKEIQKLEDDLAGATDSGLARWIRYRIMLLKALLSEEAR
jgi:hypothetical protein